MRRIALSCSSLLLVVSLACDGEDKGDDKAEDSKGEKSDGAPAKGDGEAAEAGDAADEAVDQAKDEAAAEVDKSKDRGEASAKLGDREFVAESARAKLQDDKLTLTFSRMDTIDGKMTRQAFTFKVTDYEGPGEYTISNMSSNYSGVGFDVERAKKAVDEDGKTDDAKVTAQAIDTINKSEIILLQGAKVTITAASDDEYSGTFEWTPQGGFSNKPPIKDGKFRATVRHKK